MAAATNAHRPADVTIEWRSQFTEYAADSGTREPITRAMSSLEWHRTLPNTAYARLREDVSYLRTQPLAFGLSKTFRPRKPKTLSRLLWGAHEFGDTCGLVAQVDFNESNYEHFSVLSVYVSYHLTYGRAYTQIASAHWSVPEPEQPTCAYCLAGIHDLCADRVPGLIGLPARRRTT